MSAARADIVIPTAGRPALARLLAALGSAGGPPPGRIVVVDDRAAPAEPIDLTPLGPLAARAEVVTSGGRGPAAARNAGWRRGVAPWVAFLDDDVVTVPGWLAHLDDDLAEAGPGDAAVQGRVIVPLPAGRRPTDRERCVAGLAGAAWVTADMAYRRAALVELGGFDERFPRAYREDTDLALRAGDAGWTLRRGRRAVVHPVGPAGVLASVRAQTGNADDTLMRALHGAGWRERAGVPRGRRAWHLAITAAGVVAAAGLAACLRGPAAAALAVWAAGVAELAVARIRPGPRSPAEVGTMALTSVLIPPAASWHTLAGRLRARRVSGRARRSEAAAVGGAAPADLGWVVPEQPRTELPVGGTAPRLGERR